MGSKWKWAGVVFLLAIALSLPLFIRLPYVLHVLILSLMFVSFALSFDIGAGHVGTISLAHPAFFGLGAYVAGILGTKYNFPFWANMVVAAILALILAFLIARPAFRLREISFAIATLGLALFAQLVANNWIKLTEGPMCINGIPRPSLVLNGGGTIVVANQLTYYYLWLAVALFVIIIYLLLTTWRLGRTLTAIRNDEVLASCVGIDVLRYKRLAFLVGACMAGAIGSLWAQYLTVVCPELMDVEYTNTLLIIVFVGGAGNLLGVTASAILLTIVPEILRVAPALRMILFGIVLLVVIVNAPRGLAGVFSSLAERVSGLGTAHHLGQDLNTGRDKDS